MAENLGSGIPVKAKETRLYAVLLSADEMLHLIVLAERDADKSTDGKEPSAAVTAAVKLREALARADAKK